MAFVNTAQVTLHGSRHSSADDDFILEPGHLSNAFVGRSDGVGDPRRALVGDGAERGLWIGSNPDYHEFREFLSLQGDQEVVGKQLRSTLGGLP